MTELLELLRKKREAAGIEEVKQPKSLEVKIQNKIESLMKNSKYTPKHSSVICSRTIKTVCSNIKVVDGIKTREKALEILFCQNDSVEFWEEYENQKKLSQKIRDFNAFEKELKMLKGPGFNSQKLRILYEWFYDFDFLEKLEKTSQFIKYFFSDKLLYLLALFLEYCGIDETFLHSIRTEENRILLI